MPSALLRSCPTQGCPNLTAAGRCPACRQQQDTARNDKRKFYWSRRWRRVRLRKLRNEPLCEDCKAEGRVEAAVEVHHEKDPTDYPAFAYDERYLRSLCKSHHSRRTRAGQASR